MQLNREGVSLTELEWDAEVKQLLAVFNLKETEETWNRFEDAIVRLTLVTRGSYSLPNFLPGMKRLKPGLIGCVTYSNALCASTTSSNTNHARASADQHRADPLGAPGLLSGAGIVSVAEGRL